jgi:hypothetical protein
MQWTLEYVVQSGLWLILWLAVGSAAAYTVHRRDR